MAVRQATSRNPASDTGDGTLGKSHAASLNGIFAQSPLLTDDMLPDAVKANYLATVLNGTVQNGYGFSEDVVMNYSHEGAPSGPPDMTHTHSNGTHAFIPNPMTDGSEPPAAYKDAGEVKPTAPSTTSEKLAGSAKLSFQFQMHQMR